MERHHPNYLGVWVWLAALMLLSVFASYLPAPAVLVLGVILTLSLIKAILVAVYYMHLKFEPRILLLVVICPLVLAGVLVFGVLPDSAQVKHRAPQPPTVHADESHTTAPHP